MFRRLPVLAKIDRYRAAAVKSAVDELANFFEMTGGTEHFVFVNDVVRVGGHEDLARFAEVEFRRIITEEFAMDRAPNQTAVRVDIDLGNAKFRGREILLFINAAGILHCAASVIDTGNPFRGNRRTAVHDEREVRLNLIDGSLNLFEDVEVKTLSSGEFERAMRGANRDGKGVDAGLFNELSGLRRISQFNGTNNVFFNAAELSEFGFNNDIFGVRGVDNAFGDLDVLREFFVRGVDHDGAVETAVDAVVADFFGTVVKVNGENGVREDFVGGADHTFEEALIGIIAGATGNLDDERGALGGVAGIFVFGGFTEVAAEKTDNLLEVVDVVRPDCVFAIGGFEQFFCRNDH